MKTMIILACLASIQAGMLMGQGFESFDNFQGGSGSYASGSFTGTDGSEWTYFQCRGDKFINAPTPCLGKKRNPLSRLSSGLIHNGCRKIVFSYRQAFSSAVNLNLLLNGTLVRNITTAGGYGDTAEVHTTDSIEVNLAGDFRIEFRQADSLNSGQVCIDDVGWTSFEQGLGADEGDSAQAFTALRAVCRAERQITVFTAEQGEKRLMIFSADGRMVCESAFLSSRLDLDMGGCREGLYVLILRNREKIILGRACLVLK